MSYAGHTAQCENTSQLGVTCSGGIEADGALMEHLKQCWSGDGRALAGI